VDAGVLALFKDGLPALSTKLSREQVLERLDAAARRGKLAGFEKVSGAALFEVEAYSTPFDHVLRATAGADGGGTRLRFRTQMLRKVPVIFGIGTLVTIWPGLPLTHSMLITYFSGYRLSELMTAAWYLPLTVLPLLWWIPRAIRKSRAGAAEASREQIMKLRDLLDGTLTQG
jgi:hypothetical protein